MSSKNTLLELRQLLLMGVIEICDSKKQVCGLEKRPARRMVIKVENIKSAFLSELLCLYKHTYTHVPLWSEFTKKVLRNVSGVHRALLIATNFLEKIHRNNSILLVRHLHLSGGIPKCNYLHLYQFPELSEFSSALLCVCACTLSQGAKAAVNEVTYS